MKTTKKVKAPVKTTRRSQPKQQDLGKTIDNYYRARAKRLALQQKIDEMRKEETQIKSDLIMLLSAQGLERAAGRTASVSISTKLFPRVEDWAVVHEYLRKKNLLNLLQKRLNVESIREMWEGGERIPGVEAESIVDLNMAKLSR